jgi:hypothetical protein
MKKTTPFLFVVLLLGASLLAACGQTGTPGTGAVVPAATDSSQSSGSNSIPSSSDACSLVPKDAVSQVLGQAVVAVTPKGLGGDCLYTAASLSFELTFFTSGGTQYMQDTRAKLGDLALDVPGLGDEAFYNTNSFVNTLMVRKGDAVYLVDVMNAPSSQELSPDGVRAMEKALAEQLLSNLH